MSLPCPFQGQHNVANHYKSHPSQETYERTQLDIFEMDLKSKNSSSISKIKRDNDYTTFNSPLIFKYR